jgi:hypothetical protein
VGELSIELKNQLAKINIDRYYQHSNISSDDFTIDELMEKLLLDPFCTPIA